MLSRSSFSHRSILVPIGQAAPGADQAGGAAAPSSSSSASTLPKADQSDASDAVTSSPPAEQETAAPVDRGTKDNEAAAVAAKTETPQEVSCAWRCASDGHLPRDLGTTDLRHVLTVHDRR